MLSLPTAIPADCRVNGSEIDVDQAALTGESLPVTFYKGDSCKMGSTVVRGEVEATVEFTGIDTFFGKTASLLASTGEVSHLQKVLMSFMMILVVMSVTLCLISFIYLLVEKVPVKEALSHVSQYPTMCAADESQIIGHLLSHMPIIPSANLHRLSFFWLHPSLLPSRLLPTLLLPSDRKRSPTMVPSLLVYRPSRIWQACRSFAPTKLALSL